MSDTKLRFHPFFPDTDECNTQQHDCDENAKCINTEPGYKCQCKPGYKEYDDGRKCKGTVLSCSLVVWVSVFLPMYIFSSVYLSDALK